MIFSYNLYYPLDPLEIPFITGGLDEQISDFNTIFGYHNGNLLSETDLSLLLSTLIDHFMNERTNHLFEQIYSHAEQIVSMDFAESLVKPNSQTQFRTT